MNYFCTIDDTDTTTTPISCRHVPETQKGDEIANTPSTPNKETQNGPKVYRTYSIDVVNFTGTIRIVQQERQSKQQEQQCSGRYNSPNENHYSDTSRCTKTDCKSIHLNSMTCTQAHDHSVENDPQRPLPSHNGSNNDHDRTTKNKFVEVLIPRSESTSQIQPPPLPPPPSLPVLVEQETIVSSSILDSDHELLSSHPRQQHHHTHSQEIENQLYSHIHPQSTHSSVHSFCSTSNNFMNNNNNKNNNNNPTNPYFQNDSTASPPLSNYMKHQIHPDLDSYSLKYSKSDSVFDKYYCRYPITRRYKENPIIFRMPPALRLHWEEQIHNQLRFRTILKQQQLQQQKKDIQTRSNRNFSRNEQIKNRYEGDNDITSKTIYQSPKEWNSNSLSSNNKNATVHDSGSCHSGYSSLYPSKLHALCASPYITLEEFETEMHQLKLSNQLQQTIQLKDALGRLPIHIVTDNVALLSSLPIRDDDDNNNKRQDDNNHVRNSHGMNGKDIASEMVYQLLHYYLSSMTICCTGRNRMPFISLLEEWVNHIYSPNFSPSNLKLSVLPSSHQQELTKTNVSYNTSLQNVRNLIVDSIVTTKEGITTSIVNINKQLNDIDASAHEPVQNCPPYSNSNVQQGTNSNGSIEGPLKDVSKFDPEEQNFMNGIKTSLRCHDQRLEQKQERQSHNDKKSSTWNEHKLFPSAIIWDEVEWSLTMLSRITDGLCRNLCAEDDSSTCSEESETNHSTHNEYDKEDPRTVVAQHILQVCPTIVKTILLIDQDNGTVRERILQLSIVKRMLLCHESVGPWLTQMLRKTNRSQYAVDYLIMISELTIQDYDPGIQTNGDNSRRRNIVGNSTTIYSSRNHSRKTNHLHRKHSSSDHDKIHRKFRENQRLVFLKVQQTTGFAASLALLEEKEVERVSTTAVVRYMISKNLAKPFLVGIVLMDIILHITLMQAFRSDVILYTGSEGTISSFLGTVPLNVAMYICSHYLIRKFCEAMSLLALSVKCFRAHFTRLRVVVDLITILTLLFVMAWNKENLGSYRGGWNAFVTGFLWLRVLGYLQIINQQMATFVLALIQILKDLRFFSIVLVVCIFMFGDMMQIVVSSKDNGQFCQITENRSGTVKDFCSGSSTTAYLRVYSLLIGDFQLDDFREITSLTILFTVFTLVGVVIMLNVLIAVVSDSYERSKIGSDVLFGVARVSFVSEFEALEDFLRPGSNPFSNIVRTNRRNIVKVFSRIFRWIVLISLIITAMVTETFLISHAILLKQKDEFVLVHFIVTVILAFFLTIALWIVSRFALEGVIHQYAPPTISQGFDVSSKWTEGLVVEKLSGCLFGQRRDPFSKTNGNKNVWNSKTEYMERIIQKSLKEVKEDLISEIKDLEKRIGKHQVANHDL